MCWLFSKGLKAIRQKVRDVSIFFSNGKDDFIIFLFGERIQEGEKGIFDGIRSHKCSNDGNPVYGVDSESQVI